MNVTDETVPEEDLEEAEDAGVVEKRPRRKLFYIEAGKRGTLAKIMIGSILALVLFSLVINSYVQLNEVYSQISAAEKFFDENIIDIINAGFTVASILSILSTAGLGAGVIATLKGILKKKGAEAAIA